MVAYQVKRRTGSSPNNQGVVQQNVDVSLKVRSFEFEG